MAAQNRYLSGDINPYIAPVKGSTVIEAGDLVFLDGGTSGQGGMRGNGTAADFHVYPFSDLKPSTGVLTCGGIIMFSFLGIAMESSPSGVTENITVATTGLFRMPIHPTFIGSAVTLGSLVSAVSNELAAGVSKDYVVMTTTNPGGTSYLGYCQKTESATTYVDFELMSTFGPYGMAV